MGVHLQCWMSCVGKNLIPHMVPSLISSISKDVIAKLGPGVRRLILVFIESQVPL